LPSNGSVLRRLPSLLRVPRVGSPLSRGTTKALRLPAVLPAALRFLRLAVPSRALVASLPQVAERGARRPGLWSAGFPQTGITRTETTGPPRFLGGPPCARALLFDPGEARDARPFGVPGAAAAHLNHVGLLESHFRGSTTRLALSLSTLRRMDHSTAAQDSLPAGRPAFAGQAWLPAGSTSGGFNDEAALYIASPSSRLLLAQSGLAVAHMWQCKTSQRVAPVCPTWWWRAQASAEGADRTADSASSGWPWPWLRVDPPGPPCRHVQRGA
jgi:hypothetical protein